MTEEPRGLPLSPKTHAVRLYETPCAVAWALIVGEHIGSPLRTRRINRRANYRVDRKSVHPTKLRNVIA
ncbi:MAG: hypothetical protein ACYC54_03390 [Sedimentisphaerales bacterium]